MRYLTISLLSMGLALGGCGGEGGTDGSSEANVSSSEISVPWAVSSVDRPCANTTKLNLVNGLYAAWLSANSYSHLVPLSKELERRGFGNVGEASQWGRDFQAMQAAEGARREGLRNALVRTPHLERKLDFFSKGSTQVTWTEHRSVPMVFITFRGTEAEEAEDVIRDMNFLQVASDPAPGEIHRGFRNGLSDVQDLLDARLARLRPGTEVVVTGHSLGGAIATVFASKLLVREGRPYKLSALYTFGSPRVGDREFVTAFEERAKAAGVISGRFKNERDLVTDVPKIGYWHVGALVHLDEDKIVVDPMDWFDLSRPSHHPSKKYHDKLVRFFAGGYDVEGGRRDELARCPAR